MVLCGGGSGGQGEGKREIGEGGGQGIHVIWSNCLFLHFFFFFFLRPSKAPVTDSIRRGGGVGNHRQ